MFMNNPEFKRNVWLELSPQRLVLMPAVLCIIGLLSVYLSSKDSGISTTLGVFSTLGAGLAGLWGSVAVMHSINSEISDRTWDQQRLSVLSPWQMAWGKLLGASIYPWFGSLLCAVVVLICSLFQAQTMQTIQLLLSTTLGIMSIHCWFMAMRLYTMNANTDIATVNSSRKTLGFLVLLYFLFVFGRIATMSILGMQEDAAGMKNWWGFSFCLPNFYLLMACLSLGLGLLALWRTMCKQLMVRTIPWAWALGCLAVGLIMAGFVPATVTWHAWPQVCASLCLAATYFALFSEKNTRTVWQAISFHARRNAWRRMLQTLPLWPVSLILALMLAIIYTLSGGARHSDDIKHMSLFVSISTPGLLWMLLLHTLRNVGIFLFFAWRNTRRNPAGMTLLVYFLLSGVLPLFFLNDSHPLRAIFEPLYGVYNAGDNTGSETQFSLFSWICMVVHLIIMAGLLVWRWQQKTIDQ